MSKTTLMIIGCCILLSSPAMAEQIKCFNEFGECTIDENSFGCNCVVGFAVGGSTDADDDPDAGSEMTDQFCQEKLAENCPTFENCQSDKGQCRVFDNGESSCVCADGSGDHDMHDNDESSEDGDTVPDGDVTVDGDDTAIDELEETNSAFKDGEQSCGDLLLEECPNDPPDAEEACAEDAYEACNGIISWYVGCVGNVTVWPYLIIECCDEYDDDTMDTWDCLNGKSCEDGQTECYVDGDDGEIAVSDGDEAEDGDVNTADGDVADDGSGKDLDGESESSDDGSGDGCSQSGSPAGFVLILMVLFLSFRKRIFNI